MADLYETAAIGVKMLTQIETLEDSGLGLSMSFLFEGGGWHVTCGRHDIYAIGFSVAIDALTRALLAEGATRGRT